MPSVIEEMRKISTEYFVIRLWLDCGRAEADEMAMLAGMIVTHENKDNAREVAMLLAEELSFVNAVEVVNHMGYGTVVYPDWP